jgi:outer membrane lipoprotein carrier protein
MMKVFSLLMFLFISVFGFSQAQMLKASDSDPKAKKLLDALKKDYNSYKSIEVGFELIIELSGQAKETQSGKLIQQGEKYYVSLADQEIFCDGKSVWLYLKSMKEAQLNNAESGISEDFVSPKDMLRMYENGKYAYAITGEVVENGTNVTQIEFKPLDKKSPYSKLRLSVNKKTNKASSLKIFSKDGSRYTLNVKNIMPNKAYTADVFVFNTKKYPGVRVEDLRID